MTNHTVTVALLPDVWAELNAQADRTGLSRTDLINRAITLYGLIDARVERGDRLALILPDGEIDGITYT